LKPPPLPPKLRPKKFLLDPDIYEEQAEVPQAAAPQGEVLVSEPRLSQAAMDQINKIRTTKKVGDKNFTPSMQYAAIKNVIRGDLDPSLVPKLKGVNNELKITNLLRRLGYKGKGMIGKGSQHNSRQNIAFGKFFIDKKKLDDNMLSFTHQKNNHPVTNFPMSKISDNLKGVILEILSGLAVNLNVLNDKESKFLSYIISKSKLKFNNKLSNNNRELVKRLEILVGARKSGNNSIIVKNELSDILNKLHQAGHMSAQQLKTATKEHILKK